MSIQTRPDMLENDIWRRHPDHMEPLLAVCSYFPPSLKADDADDHNIASAWV
ncbi:MAG: hypothetical protein ACPHL6_03150 [Rubripirellula sp.]